jgi:hypothetical protein
LILSSGADWDGASGGPASDRNMSSWQGTGAKCVEDLRNQVTTVMWMRRSVRGDP